jgi:hypothetical protein
VVVFRGGSTGELGRESAVVVAMRDEAGSGTGILIAGVRRFGREIFVLTGAPAGPWWPVGIPVAGRRDGSGRGQLEQLRSSGGSRWVLLCPGAPWWRGGARESGRPAGPGRRGMADGDGTVV